MKTLICALALTLSACVTAPKIAPLGANRYLVTTSNDACGNCTPAEIRAAEESSAYCAARSKSATVIDTQVQTFDLGFGHRVLMTFSCD